MGESGTDSGLFRPGDDVGRAWDEAEAILRASDDLDRVMVTIRDAESPVAARRALKKLGFTGRQAAILLTLPVLSFTRSERERLQASRRARTELLADVTGTIPVVRDPAPEVGPPPESPADASAYALTEAAGAPEVASTAEAQHSAATSTSVAEDRSSDQAARTSDWTAWESEFDGTLDRIRAAMDDHYGVAGVSPTVIDAPGLPPVPEPTDGRSASRGHDHAVQPRQLAEPWQPEQHEVSEVPEQPVEPEEVTRPGRRSAGSGPEDAARVIDEQIGELCEAIAAHLRVQPPPAPRLDDPRESTSPTGQLLGSCGVDDATGIRTLLWHLHRTGLESVEALLPFAEPLPGVRGFDVQSAQFEAAMVAGGLASDPGGSATWAGRLWPIADRRGFGYAVHYRPGPGAGAVWAYGGGEPLYPLWDSVVDMLVELYQALTSGESIDGALAEVVDGRMEWTNLA